MAISKKRNFSLDESSQKLVRTDVSLLIQLNCLFLLLCFPCWSNSKKKENQVEWISPICRSTFYSRNGRRKEKKSGRRFSFFSVTEREKRKGKKNINNRRSRFLFLTCSSWIIKNVPLLKQPWINERNSIDFPFRFFDKYWRFNSHSKQNESCRQVSQCAERLSCRFLVIWSVIRDIGQRIRLSSFDPSICMFQHLHSEKKCSSPRFFFFFFFFFSFIDRLFIANSKKKEKNIESSRF